MTNTVQNPNNLPASRAVPGLPGVINPDKIKTGLFLIATASIVICVLMCIMAIWDNVEPAAAFKTIASAGVLGAGGVLFDLMNRKFG